MCRWYREPVTLRGYPRPLTCSRFRAVIRGMPPSFQVLPGLPGEGPYPEQFTTSGGTHREGFVVRVWSDLGAPWVGNFQPGGGLLSRVLRHPNGRLLLVVSRGLVYPIDPETRKLAGPTLDGIDDAYERTDLLVLVGFTDLTILGPADREWRTPRLAWDGFKNLRVEGPRLTGEGWDAVNDSWRRVEVDLVTHQVIGSAYDFKQPTRGR